MGVEWDYYDKYEDITDKYMLPQGEGNTKASQIVTAVNKLIYKWYNDGDVYDNTKGLSGWCNDLSSYANWLYHYSTFKAADILDKIDNCFSHGQYEDLLKELADELLREDILSDMALQSKVSSIYDCNGKFKFVEGYDDEW